MDKKLRDILTYFKEKEGNLIVLTGAGISSESGIPTFRGKDGYWVVGSENHQFQEIGTHRFFEKDPYESWRWVLFRRGVCRKAKPNPSHERIAKLEDYFLDRFCVVTQNVDNLHLEAGNSVDRTFEVHGNLNRMRCSVECSDEVYEMPEELVLNSREELLTDEQKNILKCPKCGSLARAHVLWWDECYNEKFYRIETMRNKAKSADLLITIGTSASANVAVTTFYLVKDNAASIVDINPEYSPLGDVAKYYEHGFWCRGTSKEYLPQIVNFLCA